MKVLGASLFVCFSVINQIVKTEASPHEEIHYIPDGWVLAGKPRDDHTLKLRVNLVQENLPLLETALRQVSDPESSCYGHYLEREEVESLFSPSQKARQTVIAWLLDSGIPRHEIELDKQHVSLELDARQANEILNTTFHAYTDGHVERVRTTRYHVPPSVSEFIHSITPTVVFGQASTVTPRQQARRESKKEHARSPSLPNVNSVESSDMSACQTYWTPKCLQQVYNTTAYHADPSSGSQIAFAAFLNDTASFSDIGQFEELFSLPPSNLTLISIDHGNMMQDPNNPESHVVDLDVFTISSITQNALPIIQYSVGGPPPPFTPNVGRPHISDNDNEPYLRLFEYLLSKPNSELPQVITASYSEDEQTVPLRYAQRVCNAIGMLGLRGVSVIHTMAGTGPGTSCTSNDGKNTSQLTPQFPASCPWITGVGETNQTNPLTTYNISSGGFSWYFPRPWYQHDAVSHYLSTLDPVTHEYYDPLMNAHGRASPEISLQGYRPDDPGTWTGTPATSHFSGATRGNSALAGLVGLLNDARLRNNLPPMGFLNPWLYRYSKTILTDITRGASLGCLGRNIQFDRVIPGATRIPWIAWNATEGWDPASGLGFPEDFETLRRVALGIGLEGEGAGEGKRGIFEGRFGGERDYCPYRWWEIGRA